MTTRKWVNCTKELAENPDRVKVWHIGGQEVRFLCHDENHREKIVGRYKHNDELRSAPYNVVHCLIEVPIQEEYLTFYEGNDGIRMISATLEQAKKYKSDDCTHIVKLTFDGEKFDAELVWKKDNN